MAEEFFKGLGRYIPPEIRRFAPAVKTVTELLRPTQIVKNPAVSNLVRSPSLANVGNVLSNRTSFIHLDNDSIGIYCVI